MRYECEVVLILSLVFNMKYKMIKKHFFCIVIFLIGILTSVQGRRSDSTRHVGINLERVQLTTDTLKLAIIKPVETEKVWYEQEKNMPWIASTVIALCSILANIIISWRSMKTTMKVTRLNIENSQNSLSTQFNITLNTKNRQDWINTLRDSVSEFLAQSNMLVVGYDTSGKPTFDEKKHPEIYEKLNYQCSKIAMLLNPDKEEQRKLIESVFDMVRICTSIMDNDSIHLFSDKQNEIVKLSQELIRIHWKKIKDETRV